MNLTELLTECELLDKEATPGPWLHRSCEGGWDAVVSERDLDICRLSYNHPENASMIARSRTLLPLLVSVIKNQQEALERIVDISLASDRPAPISDSEFHAFKLFDIRGIAREVLRLEDIS